MTRVNVYLPDDLAAQARAAGVNVSAITQDGVRQALAARSTDAWLATLGAVRRPPSLEVGHDAALAALDAVREEPSTRHG